MMSQDQKTAPPSPEISHSIDPQGLVLEQDRAYFAQHGMAAHNLTPRRLAVLDLSNLKPLEARNGRALFAVLDAAGTAVQIYGAVGESGRYEGGPLALARADMNIYEDKDVHGRTIAAGDEGVRWPAVFLPTGRAPEVFGRAQLNAAALGLEDELVSRQHFGITHLASAKLRIEDFDSANGTRVITRVPEALGMAKLGAKAKRWLGGKATR